MPDAAAHLPVLRYLQDSLTAGPTASTICGLTYPTAISRLLGFRIVEVGEASAVIEVEVDAMVHGNQQGSVHGGFLCELADAAIGTAHSTLMQPQESFVSVDLRTVFLRPVWRARLRAHAHAVHRGRTLSHYQCEITRDDGKPVALVTSAVMTLRATRAER